MSWQLGRWFFEWIPILWHLVDAINQHLPSWISPDYFWQDTAFLLLIAVYIVTIRRYQRIIRELREQRAEVAGYAAALEDMLFHQRGVERISSRGKAVSRRKVLHMWAKRLCNIVKRRWGVVLLIVVVVLVLVVVRFVN